MTRPQHLVATSGPGLVQRLIEQARSRDIVANAVSLFGATLVTSFLGFAFWALAARVYDTADIGRVSAAISAMQLLALAGVLGLGTLIIGEVRRVADPGALVSTGTVVAGVVTGALALATASAGPVLGLHLGRLQEWPVGPPAFALGAALTGSTVVLDQACIGILRGGLQFWRNAVFAAGKLLLLPVGLLLHGGGAVPLYLVWAAGNVLSLITMAAHARRLGLRPRLRLRVSALAGLRGAALSHHWLNLAGSAPGLLLPVVVLATLGARPTAAFYAALLLAGFVGVVPVHLSTALFALARGDVRGLRSEARFSLTVCAAVSSVSTVALLVIGRPVLRLLGPDYTAGATTLVLFVAATLPAAVGAHYIAVQRVHDRLRRAGWATTAAGLFEVGAALLGGLTGHLDAVGAFYLVANVVIAVAMWPTVARAAGLWPFHGPVTPDVVVETVAEPPRERQLEPALELPLVSPTVPPAVVSPSVPPAVVPDAQVAPAAAAEVATLVLGEATAGGVALAGVQQGGYGPAHLLPPASAQRRAVPALQPALHRAPDSEDGLQPVLPTQPQPATTAPLDGPADESGKTAQLPPSPAA